MIIFFVDLPDPNNSGKTIRESNATILHKIATGSLVEIINTGVRLFVVWLGRDCDMEPLYWLSPKIEDVDNYKNKDPKDLLPIGNKLVGGYLEQSLIVIKQAK